VTADGEQWREAARNQDVAIAARGLTLWIGAEPTFTLRSSQDPAWLSAAEGADKAERARALLLSLAPRLSPAPVLFRSAGRRYPGEKSPRFCYGALFPLLAAPRTSP
jgi:uncharacterized protein (DUF2126 family)